MNTSLRLRQWGARMLRACLLVIFVLTFPCAGPAAASVKAVGQPFYEARAGDPAQSGEESGTSTSLQSFQRTLSFPASVLIYDKDSTVLTRNDLGILWNASSTGGAWLSLPRPADWDRLSAVTLRLEFFVTDGSPGMVDFYILSRAYNPGDTVGSFTVPVGSPGSPAAGPWRVGEQVFQIPAEKFGSKVLWVITILRGAGGETYASPVVLTSFSLTYTSAPFGKVVLGFPANALNYDDNSTILRQFPSGIEWVADARDSAELSLLRPVDWDGTSDVTLRLYFYPPTSMDGVCAKFNIRPRAYNPGDTYGDADSLDGYFKHMEKGYQVQDQVFTIPAERFGSKAQWVITLQRGQDADFHCVRNVILMALSLEYTKNQVQPAAISLPANSLNYARCGPILTQSKTGIFWQADFTQAGTLAVPRPADWDRTSPVILRLYFYTTTAPVSGSNVSFFIRPRAYDPEDFYGDAVILSSPAVPVTVRRQVREQVFTIPAERFGSKAQWVIPLQRGLIEDSYTNAVILTTYSLTYLTNRVYLPGVMK